MTDKADETDKEARKTGPGAPVQPLRALLHHA
jgi:hypothetical protein